MKNIRDTKVRGIMTINVHTEVHIDLANPELREALKKQHCDIYEMSLEDIIEFAWTYLPELLEEQDSVGEDFDEVYNIETID